MPPMNTLFDAAARRALLERVRRLRDLEPDRKPEWGRMSAPLMVRHCAASLRQGLGELETSREPHGLLSRWPFYWLAIHVLPWPKGKVEAPPELLDVSPGEWEEDIDELASLVERFGEADPGGEWPRHGLFGRIPGRSWGVLQYRHLDHHLRQFGV